MRAITLVPGKQGTLGLTEVPDPRPGPGELLVQGLALGVCGTDRELVSGEYGFPGGGPMVLGHESLGRVLQAPDGSAFSPGDLVVGVVRRPDPVPCGACARGEFDMCRNGEYTERGIKGRDGYGSERWTVEAGYAVRVDPALGMLGVLVEPASVLAKAWEHIERIGSRAWFQPERLLVTGAGPIGLLAALMGRQRGLEVHVMDRAASGLKPELVAGLGATYHQGGDLDAVGGYLPDLIIEATGSGPLIFQAMLSTASAGIVCLTGVSSAGRQVRADAGLINRDIVLENDVVFGTVNANLRHYRAAATALGEADRSWLDALITRRLPMEEFGAAFDTGEHIKVVITLEV
ncbi:glucose 1-dehydrogenase [Nonomuraea sp. MCN248]|uniref:Glucose 1-dehydrogenase n=1 Tax=Nonomuraea corallina TaxID=2989783 RepID=A0ABT4SFP6_9ACTN|nr:glucose 1-dehydrogenase [Nonomuraea corallina]MDA0635795.1 glucose 1-dehydrogenase [Nonomuraea corallina]